MMQSTAALRAFDIHIPNKFLAEVIGHVPNAAVFQDETGKLYYYHLPQPDMMPMYSVADIRELHPVEHAEPALRASILHHYRGRS